MRSSESDLREDREIELLRPIDVNQLLVLATAMGTAMAKVTDLVMDLVAAPVLKQDRELEGKRQKAAGRARTRSEVALS